MSSPTPAPDREAGHPGGYFAVGPFLAVLVPSLAAALLGDLLPVVGSFGGLLAALASGFLLGVVGERAYPETAAAGALAVGLGTFLDHLALAALTALAGLGLPLVAAGALAGGGAGLVGHYLGRDLHAGLTRDL